MSYRTSKKGKLGKEIRVYLSEFEKETLTVKAKQNNQGLSTYAREKLTRRINKLDMSSEVVAARVALSKVKQSTMIMRTIARDTDNSVLRDKMLQELDNLIGIIDPAIMALMRVDKDDSSNLSES